MEFHLYLANHHPHSLVLLEDLVRPIVAGLEDLGHQVASYSTELVMAPRINLLVEFFPDDTLVDGLMQLKQGLGDRFLFGLICTEDMADPMVWRLSGPKRLAGLKRLLPLADFAWTLLPPEGYTQLISAERVARIEYGFSPRLVPACYFADPAQRDIDVLIYGSPYHYREPVRDEIERLGLNCAFTVSSARVGGQINMLGLPRYLADEMIARAKILIDMRRGTQIRSLSVTRLSAGLHAGCAIVAEEFEAGETAWLYRYTRPAPYAEIARTCARLIREQDCIAMGRQARERFEAETSMRANMAVALNLPFFRSFS